MFLFLTTYFNQVFVIVLSILPLLIHGEADAEAKAKAEADPEADPSYGHGGWGRAGLFR
jgi:hypothetical protein